MQGMRVRQRKQPGFIVNRIRRIERPTATVFPTLWIAWTCAIHSAVFGKTAIIVIIPVDCLLKAFAKVWACFERAKHLVTQIRGNPIERVIDCRLGVGSLLNANLAPIIIPAYMRFDNR